MDDSGPFDGSSTTGERPEFFRKYKLQRKSARIVRALILNCLFVSYFAWATYHYIDLHRAAETQYCQGDCGFEWCDGYGMLLILTVPTYLALFYYKLFKPKYGASIGKPLFDYYNDALAQSLRKK